MKHMHLPALVLVSALAMALAGCVGSGSSPSSSLSDEDYLSFGQEQGELAGQTGEDPPACPPGTRRAGYSGVYYCRPLPSSSTTPDPYADTDTPQDECPEAVDLLGLNRCGSMEPSPGLVTYEVDTSADGTGTWPIDISAFVDNDVRPNARDLSWADPNSYLGLENGNLAFRYRMVGRGFPGIFLMQTREHDPDGTAEGEDLSSGFGFGGWLRNGHFGVQYVPEGDDGFVMASHGGDHRGHPRKLDGYRGVWKGSMVAIDRNKVNIADGEYGTLYGDASIEGTFHRGDGGMKEIDVRFTNIHYIENDEPYADIAYIDVPVSNGRFVQSGEGTQPSEISGGFMRTNQIEVVGAFRYRDKEGEYDDIGGAFGAYRQTTDATDENPSDGID